jgi:hypothetical protein
MRSFTVVLLSPRFDRFLGTRDGLEPVGIQAFIPQAPVETLHAAVLHRPAWLNVNQPDLAILAPARKWRLETRVRYRIALPVACRAAE